MGLLTPKRLQKPHAAQNFAPVQEKRAAAVIGGKVTRGSGSGFEKCDVRLKGVLRLECKCTAKKSFALTQSMLNTLEAATAGTEELPVIEVQYLDAKGKPKHTVYVMPKWAMETIILQHASRTKRIA
jgi:hypothetical protein